MYYTVGRLCPNLCDPIDCNPPGFYVHVILQARILEWIAIPFSRGFPTLGSNPGLLHTSTSVQSVSSVAQSCLTLCDSMNRSTPSLPVHHQLPEFTQTHAHQVGDAIQPSYLLSSPSPPAPNPSQHQGLFQ